MEKIVMGTSIAPFEIQRQIICIKTWIDSQFEVISFNTAEEIKVLQPYFKDLGVKFCIINRDAEQVAGKPLPYIQDILNEVSRRTRQVCGFFNADIFLSGVSEKMYDFIVKEAKNSMIYVRRNEIAGDEDIWKTDWRIHFDGIDVFFIDKDQAEVFNGDNYFVQSIWDLFIIEKCKMNHINVKELVNPIAFHKRHIVKWNFEISNYFAEEFGHRYWGNSESAYGNAINRYYQNLWEYIEKICYCDNLDRKCLVVLDRCDDETLKSAKEQEYPNVVVTEDDTDKIKYDYVFYIKKNVILDKLYCKAVIYIMEQFSLNELEMGCFFISKTEGKWGYNSLNRNMEVVYEINDKCSLNTVIQRNAWDAGEKGRICCPVLFKKIDIDNGAFIRQINFQGRAYMMPAGVRANEWYEINRNKLQKLEIVGFIDNNIDKMGKDLFGKRVYSVEQICENDTDSQVVVASKYYSSEIKQQLSEVIEEKRVLDIGYILWIDKEGTGYYLELEQYKKFIGNQYDL